MQIDYSIYETPAIFRKQPDWALPKAKLAAIEVRGSTENVIYDLYPWAGTYFRSDKLKVAVPDGYTELDAVCAWAQEQLKQGEFDRKPDGDDPYPCFTAKAFTVLDTDGVPRAEFDGQSWITAPDESECETMRTRIDTLEIDYRENLRADNHHTMDQISAEIDRMRRQLAMADV